jgi:hypothetical protein
MRGTLHAHGCLHCHTRFTDACETPEYDDLCVGCRGGLVWTVMVQSANPRQCCRELARMVTKDEKSQYRLAGTRRWFICPRCARTHPFNPKTETRTP